jgi:hypothetical protein
MSSPTLSPSSVQRRSANDWIADRVLQRVAETFAGAKRAGLASAKQQFSGPKVAPSIIGTLEQPDHRIEEKGYEYDQNVRTNQQ